jgi:cytochrome oxidase assembly protein ShyY1
MDGAPYNVFLATHFSLKFAGVWLVEWLKWKNTCLASVRSSVQTPIPPQKKKKKTN